MEDRGPGARDRRARSTSALSHIGRRDLLAAAAFGGLIACSSKTAPPSAKQAVRVVSTSPSMTEIVFALGQGGSLVGRSRFCDFPPEALSIPDIGGFADPSVERILALSPTLVCGERGPAGPELPKALESHGVATFFPEMDDLSSIGRAIAELGKRIDKAAEGERLAADLDRSVADVRQKTASLPKPRVLFLFDFRPLIAAGPGSFPDELLSVAGANNVVQAGGKYPRLGLEALFAADPDVIIDGSGHGEASPTRRDVPALETLRAVRDGRIHALASSAALRPGPRLGAGMAELARLIHGSSLP
ncbi:MAG: ABC transporter substrate-binding protein [Polyangiaceae bacterium]|nr:ABC transporter substrate-binding protein [Polyangiaceae bacterium]